MLRISAGAACDHIHHCEMFAVLRLAHPDAGAVVTIAAAVVFIFLEDDAGARVIEGDVELR